MTKFAASKTLLQQRHLFYGWFNFIFGYLR